MTPVAKSKQLVEEAWESVDRWQTNYAAAEAVLRAAVAANLEDSTALICLGAVLSDRGQHAEAVRVLEKAIELGTSDRNAYLNLAIALMNCGASGRMRAEAEFRNAAELQPAHDTWEAYFDPQAH